MDISQEDLDLLALSFTEQFVKKKKDLLRIGEVCRHHAFLVKGTMRSYSIDDKGAEHVMQLAMEGHWIGDLYSLFSGAPSKLYIEAIEDSTVLIISIDKLEELYIKIPVMERFFRKLFQSAYVSTLQRLNTTLSDPADVRYQRLIEKYPDLLQRIPLSYIASYLGIAPESLSRIRKQLQERETSS